LKKIEASDVLIPVFLSLLVLLISSLIARSLEHLTTRQFLLGTAATTVVLLILVGFVIWFQNASHRSELETVIAQLKEAIPTIEYPWLYSDADLAKAETEAKGDSIWIVSPDLKNVTEKAVIIEAVKHNVKRRVTYTYIVPDSPKIDGVLPGLERLFKSTNQLDVVRVPEEEFDRLSITHYAIFNASMNAEGTPEAFLELPIIDAAGKKIRGYWIKVSHETATSLIGRFRNLVKTYSQKSRKRR
jgi:hypothetical protein